MQKEPFPECTRLSHTVKSINPRCQWLEDSRRGREENKSHKRVDNKDSKLRKKLSSSLQLRIHSWYIYPSGIQCHYLGVVIFFVYGLKNFQELIWGEVQEDSSSTNKIRQKSKVMEEATMRKRPRRKNNLLLRPTSPDPGQKRMEDRPEVHKRMDKPILLLI